METNISGRSNPDGNDASLKIPKKKPYFYEFPLNVDLIGRLIKSLRKIRSMSQEQLGRLIGVQKSQISKIEKSDKNVTFGTILKVLRALKAKVSFKVELESKKELQFVKQTIEAVDKDREEILPASKTA